MEINTSATEELDLAQGTKKVLSELGFVINGQVSSKGMEILSPDAMKFLAKITRRFSPQRLQLLAHRIAVQSKLNDGIRPSFPSETEHIRTHHWKIEPVPFDLQDRRVEITGPASDAKMVINALNSGANVFMADFEDALSPTWDNVIHGQIHLHDAVRGIITHVNPDGKHYTLNPKIATLMVRPRGWHLSERHVLLDGNPVPASLFDFSLFFFHNAHVLLSTNRYPYFYLPKLEHHLEARLWNDIFLFAQQELGIPRGTIKATVLIETILAAFEMDEILYELREHSAGLNCGRWDYIFSFIKKFHRFPEFVLPDRSSITMDKDFLAAYVKLLIKTCHRRGAHAMGGMAAQIPIKDNEVMNRAALSKVKADKEREVAEGHDGTWVAHPGLVQTAKQVFDRMMPTANQIHISKNDVAVTDKDLLKTTTGVITERGLRTNIIVGIQYIEAWLRGNGAVPLYNLMEDAATAEISRSQVWQWVHHNCIIDDGRFISRDVVRSLIDEELEKLRVAIGEEKFNAGKFSIARHVFERMVTQPEFVEFTTIAAYEYL